MQSLLTFNYVQKRKIIVFKLFKCTVKSVKRIKKALLTILYIMMYSALAELAVDCIRILLIAYAVYDLSRYCIRTTSEPANPLLDFTSDYLGELARYI